MASLEPVAGRTSLSGSSATPWRRSIQPQNASRSPCLPAVLGYLLTSGTPSIRAWRISGPSAAWVAGTEVEEIQALLLQLPAAFVEAQKRVGALLGEYGVEE